MSATITTALPTKAADNVVLATPTTDASGAPLISSSPANQATAAASGAAAGAIIVILVWVLGLIHVAVPAEVGAAFTVLVGTVIHGAVIKYGFPTQQ